MQKPNCSVTPFISSELPTHVRVLVIDNDSDGSIERLNTRRAEIESIASVKYTAGETDADGTVRV